MSNRVPSSYEWVGVQWTQSFQNKGSKWDHKGSIYFISFLDIWSQALFKWSMHLLHSTVQSTPVISRHLGAKIRERELSGSPVISREGPNSRLAGSQSHILTSAPLKPKQYVER